MQEKSSLNSQKDNPKYDAQNIDMQKDKLPTEESLTADPQKLDFYSKYLKNMNEILSKISVMNNYIAEFLGKENSTHLEKISNLEVENIPTLSEKPTEESSNMAEDEEQEKFESIEKAAESGQLDIVKSLWNEIADNLLLEDKITILKVAISNKHQDVTEFLLGQISQDLAFDNIRDVSVLLIEARDEKILDFWFTQMKELGKISVTKGIKYHAEAANTAIIAAHEKGDKETIDFIVNCQDVLKNMGMALNLAVVKGEKLTVDSLLAADSFIETPEHKIEAKYKGKALGAAVRYNNEDLLNDLLDKVGADITIKDKAKAIELSKKAEYGALGEIIMEKMSLEELQELKDLTLTSEFSGIKELVDSFYDNKYDEIAKPEENEVEVKENDNFDNSLLEEDNILEEADFSYESSNTLDVVGENKHQTDEL